MLRTVLFGLGIWAAVSVPIALLIGRMISIGAGDQLQPARALADRNCSPNQRAA